MARSRLEAALCCWADENCCALFSMHSAAVQEWSGHELFGIDFVVDDNMHVWVTEVESQPSMQVRHDAI